MCVCAHHYQDLFIQVYLQSSKQWSSLEYSLYYKLLPRYYNCITIIILYFTLYQAFNILLSILSGIINKIVINKPSIKVWVRVLKQNGGIERVRQITWNFLSLLTIAVRILDYHRPASYQAQLNHATIMLKVPTNEELDWEEKKMMMMMKKCKPGIRQFPGLLLYRRFVSLLYTQTS